MNKHKVIIILTAVFLSCNVSRQAIAQPTGSSTRLNSSVYLGDRIQAGKNSLLRLGSVRLHNSRIGSSLTMNSRVRIGGSTTLKKKAGFQAGSLTMDNGYIAENTIFHSNVDIRNSVTVGQGADVGIGGVEIVADDNYTPDSRMMGDNNIGIPPGRYQQPWTGKMRVYGKGNGSIINNSRSILATALQLQQGKNGKDLLPNTGNLIPSTIKSVAPVDRYLLFANMSKAVYGDGGKTEFNGWKKIYDTDLGSNKDDKDLRLYAGHAIVYQNSKTKEIVVAFEGTEMHVKHPVNTASDMVTDGGQVLLVPNQYKEATKVLENIWQQYGKDNKIVVTGHSLGGGLAQWAGAKLAIRHQEAKVEGVIFNSADLGVQADNYLLNHRDQLNNISMVHVRVNGDSVSGTSGRYDAGNVFPRYTEYELPSNTDGFMHGVASDHGIGVVIDKMNRHRNNFEAYRHEDQWKRKVGNAWLSFRGRK